MQYFFGFREGREAGEVMTLWCFGIGGLQW